MPLKILHRVLRLENGPHRYHVEDEQEDEGEDQHLDGIIHDVEELQRFAVKQKWDEPGHAFHYTINLNKRTQKGNDVGCNNIDYPSLMIDSSKFAEHDHCEGGVLKET